MDRKANFLNPMQSKIDCKSKEPEPLKATGKTNIRCLIIGLNLLTILLT